MREQLAEDAALADAPRDQLGVLAAEVEDQDLLGRLGGRDLVDLDELRLGARNAALGDVDPSLGVSPKRRWPLQSSVTATAAATVARPFDPMPTDCSRCSCLPSDISAGATITSARWNSGMSA